MIDVKNVSFVDLVNRLNRYTQIQFIFFIITFQWIQKTEKEKTFLKMCSLYNYIFNLLIINYYNLYANCIDKIYSSKKYIYIHNNQSVLKVFNFLKQILSVACFNKYILFLIFY